MKTLENIEIVGGHPAVDFVNTVHNWTQAGPPDYLHDFDDFLGWSEKVGLLRHSVPNFRARPKAEKVEAFEEVRRLRAHLRDIYLALGSGKRPPAEALEHLNEIVRRTVQWRRFRADGNDGCDGISCVWDLMDAPAIAALGPVAWKAAELLEHGPLDRIKECPADKCGWLFVDMSKNRSRQWCSMATCGNAAKVKRFRERQK